MSSRVKLLIYQKDPKGIFWITHLNFASRFGQPGELSLLTPTRHSALWIDPQGLKKEWRRPRSWNVPYALDLYGNIHTLHASSSNGHWRSLNHESWLPALLLAIDRATTYCTHQYSFCPVMSNANLFPLWHFILLPVNPRQANAATGEGLGTWQFPSRMIADLKT